MELHEVEEHLIYKTLSGSRAYGLALPESDTDYKGVYILPEKQFYGFEYFPQINNATSDIVYYELKRFLELLWKNNPNLLEMLFTAQEDILLKDPLFEKIKPELFLSKLCRDTFAGYAVDQIKKARGLNKKILNPIEKERKNLLHFCYIIEGRHAKELLPWLSARGMEQERCGLVNIPHMRQLYALFYDNDGSLNFQGIARESDEPRLSSVPKGLTPVGLLHCNQEGYTLYCKEYKSYWDWVEKRNDARYKTTMTHGKRYDAKNMMHTFRLLDIAEEIARTGAFTTRRPNRDELLAIKAGEFEYEELIEKAAKQMTRVQKLFDSSPLPEKPDIGAIETLLVEIREEYYRAARQEE